ncbi:hypothetical protein H8958_014871 [Nasalis larvatus]
MSTVHEILCKLSLEGEHSTPLSTYESVKAYTNFDTEQDALNTEMAIKTKGMDEITTANILTNHSNAQRQDIAFTYQRRTKKELASALKSALSGHLDSGFGPIKDTAKSFHEGSLKEYKTDLEKDIISDTSGDFSKGRRAEDGSVIDYELSDQNAWDLYDTGVKRKGTDVPTWITIMTEQSMSHLQKVFNRHKSYSPYDMLESIKKEVNGDLENAFLKLVQCIQNKPLYFADWLIMVSHNEVDMLKIRSEFKRKYNKSLYYYIQQDTKGAVPVCWRWLKLDTA